MTGAGTYEIGELVTITATPNTNYRFSGWYRGDEQVSASASYQFVLGSSTTFEARFSLIDEP